MLTSLDLRALRISKGLRQDDIGNRKDVIDIEKGRKMPGPRLIRRMAGALGVPTDEVYAACCRSCRHAGWSQDVDHAPALVENDTWSASAGAPTVSTPSRAAAPPPPPRSAPTPEAADTAVRPRVAEALVTAAAQQPDRRPVRRFPLHDGARVLALGHGFECQHCRLIGVGRPTSG